MTPPTYSPAWKSSTRTRKQRKYVWNAPAHKRHVFLSAHLAKNLRQQYKRRSAPVRVGDKVKILRGSYTGKSGSVERTDTKRHLIFITGIDATKRDGSKRLIPLQPSNLIIEELDLKDRRRFASPSLDQLPKTQKTQTKTTTHTKTTQTSTLPKTPTPKSTQPAEISTEAPIVS